MYHVAIITNNLDDSFGNFKTKKAAVEYARHLRMFKSSDYSRSQNPSVCVFKNDNVVFTLNLRKSCLKK